jgi:hypothetical protein
MTVARPQWVDVIATLPIRGGGGNFAGSLCTQRETVSRPTLASLAAVVMDPPLTRPLAPAIERAKWLSSV